VIGAELEIGARAQNGTVLRGHEETVERADGERLLVQGYAVDDGPVVDPFLLPAKVKGSAPGQRPANVALQFIQMERRLARGVRVARIPEVVGEIVLEQPTEFVGAFPDGTPQPS
jgi:hypothetical protein